MTRPSASRTGAVAFCLALSVCLVRAQEPTTTVPSAEQQQVLRIAKEVRKQIVTLPQYGVSTTSILGLRAATRLCLWGRRLDPPLNPAPKMWSRR